MAKSNALGGAGEGGTYGEGSEYRNLNNLLQHPKIAFSDDDRVPMSLAGYVFMCVYNLTELERHAILLDACLVSLQYCISHTLHITTHDPS